jgi:hypothetical protein
MATPPEVDNSDEVNDTSDFRSRRSLSDVAIKGCLSIYTTKQQAS